MLCYSLSMTDNPVKILRLQSGLSQLALSEHSGVHRSTLRLIEDGTTRHPGDDTLRALASAFGISVDILDGAWAQYVRSQRSAPTLPLPLPETAPTFKEWRMGVEPRADAFARRIGVSKATILEYERGVRQRGMSSRLQGALMNAGLPWFAVQQLAALPPAPEASDV